MPDSFDLQLLLFGCGQAPVWTQESASPLHTGEPRSNVSFQHLMVFFMISQSHFQLLLNLTKTEYLTLQCGGGNCKCLWLHMLFHF